MAGIRNSGERVIDRFPPAGLAWTEAMKERKPIFYDERRRRWALTRRVLEINGVVFTLLLVIFLLAVITRPNLPELLLPETRPALHAVRPKQPAKPAPTRIGRRRRVAGWTWSWIGNCTLGSRPPKSKFPPWHW